MNNNEEKEEKEEFTIAKLRRTIGLTQWQLAEKLGISSQSVASWEVKRYKPSPKHTRLLIEFLMANNVDKNLIIKTILKM